LHLGSATAQDVINQAGTPDEERSHPGQFSSGGGTGSPYKALGYSCQTPSDQPNLISITDSQAGPGCRTVYFINQSTGRLAAFQTSDPAYHTTSGTTPGMPQARANSLEGTVARVGCDEGITENTRGASLVILNHGGAPQADGTLAGGRVSFFQLDEVGPGRLFECA
jgi:hypothetical protein